MSDEYTWPLDSDETPDLRTPDVKLAYELASIRADMNEMAADVAQLQTLVAQMRTELKSVRSRFAG